jgi:hypothetical protein
VPPLLVRITDLKKAPKKSPILLENGSQEPTYYNVASSLSLSLSLSRCQVQVACYSGVPTGKQKHPTHKDCKEKKFFFFNKRKKHAETH